MSGPTAGAPMSPFARAMQAAAALAAEDLPLFLQTVLGRYPIAECPSLFAGRDLEDIRLLVLWLVLGFFEPAEQVEMIGVLVEKVVDREEPAALAALMRLAQWIDACLGSRA